MKGIQGLQKSTNEGEKDERLVGVVMQSCIFTKLQKYKNYNTGGIKKNFVFFNVQKLWWRSALILRYMITGSSSSSSLSRTSLKH